MRVIAFSFFVDVATKCHRDGRFVRVGAEQEVNISGTVRNKILSTEITRSVMVSLRQQVYALPSTVYAEPPLLRVGVQQ